MNVSLSSNSATNKMSSLLDTGSASSKVEETGDSKGFFESFKEALGFEESDSKVAAKDTESTAKPDTKQTSTEGEASAEANKGDSAESKATDEVSEAQSKQAASEVEGEKAADKTSAEAASGSEAQLKANSGTDSTVADKTVADKADGKDAQDTTNESKEHIAQSQTQGPSAVDGATQASQANAAMSEGNKLLGQLDEANKTLNQAPNGKGLPQQGQVEQAQGNITGASVAGVSVTDKATQQAKAANSASGEPTAIDWDNTDSSETKALAAAASTAGSTDTLLKAGAGAAALSGLGKAGAKEDSKDSTFAQQIASAASAQGTATVGSAPTRAEIQAAQQAPLQLTKELANEQVAEKVQMMMSKNLKNLDIRLDPPELGQMKIRMTMNNDVANVHFTVSNQQARDVIEQTLPRLREMLAQQGLQLADSSVQQQNSGQGQDRYNNGEQQSGANRTNDTQGDENLDSGSNLELNVASKRDGISYYA
ncbi:flagellar hook-length control protein FliK [Vibrio sp. 10N.222.52.C3]|uniref:flagellar hook-length control protein FliK n=1 Tax=Vibrio sp. 10N.222.52.C3 TaxID=3229631 RepID=UPI00354CE1D4